MRQENKAIRQAIKQIKMEENSAMLSFFKRIGVVHWEFQQISQRRWASALFVLEWFELVNRSLVDIINAFHDNQPTGEDLELAEIWSTYLLNLQQLLGSCQSLISQWEEYVDSLH